MRQVFRGWGVVTETKNCTDVYDMGLAPVAKRRMKSIHLYCEGINIIYLIP